MGSIAAIYIADTAGSPMRSITQVSAVAGRGLEGDRYYQSTGSFSRWPGEGRSITLIEVEAIEAVRAATQIDLSAGRSRRNIETRGVDLPALNGRRFRIGAALFRGSRLAAPCKYLERITEPGVYAALLGRGGLRAEILESGLIRAGDELTFA